jgi:hypothetical protein
MGWGERYVLWFFDACAAPEQHTDDRAIMPPSADPFLVLIALSALTWCYFKKVKI